MIIESYMEGQDIYTIKIGQNKLDNWNLVESSEPDNIWFHVSGAPSAHIVLVTSCNIKDIPSRVIYRCAVLCSKRSKSHNERHNIVNYTYMKYVSKGENIGEVVVKKSLAIRV
jgi:predicted ribosome quality control (RQC) complex YloA/Tae2 family protein